MMIPGPADINPAEFPHKHLHIGAGPCDDVVIAWLDHGSLFSADCLEVIDAVLTRGGGALVLCRTAEDRDRAAIVLTVLFEPDPAS